jgi:hypothetical protein
MIFLIGYVIGQVVALKAVLLVLKEANEDNEPAEGPYRPW